MDIRKGTYVGPFIVNGAISKGGMAELFEAVDQENNRKVALKISRINEVKDQTFNNSLRQEVDILTSLTHGNVVQVLPIPIANSGKTNTYAAKAVELQGQPWYYVMEYLRGGSLAGLLGKDKVLPLDVAAAIALCVANALVHIHHKGVVHLDIKPENILFRAPLGPRAALEPVLIDFGVAAHANEGRANGGTVAMMPPEYIGHSKRETAPEITIDYYRVDIYSLGVVMYRMLTGVYPFTGWGEESMTRSIRKGSYDQPTAKNSKLPPEVDQVLRRWISREPSMRPSLIDLRRILAYWASGMGPFELFEELIPGDDKHNGGLCNRV